jgi:hypothetical protein
VTIGDWQSEIDRQRENAMTTLNVTALRQIKARATRMLLYRLSRVRVRVGLQEWTEAHEQQPGLTANVDQSLSSIRADFNRESQVRSSQARRRRACMQAPDPRLSRFPRAEHHQRRRACSPHARVLPAGRTVEAVRGMRAAPCRA